VSHQQSKLASFLNIPFFKIILDLTISESIALNWSRKSDVKNEIEKLMKIIRIANILVGNLNLK
jgi:hypothetical protein